MSTCKAMSVVGGLGCPAVLTDGRGTILAGNKQAEAFLRNNAGRDVDRFFAELLAPSGTSLEVTADNSLNDGMTERVWPLPRLGGDQPVEILIESVAYFELEGEEEAQLHLLKLRSPLAHHDPAGSMAHDAGIRKCVHDLANVFGILLPSLEALVEDGLQGSESAMILANLQKTADRGATFIRQLSHSLAEARNSARAPAPVKTAPAISSPPRSTNTKASPGYERILLVDDDPHYRTLLKAALGYRGYQITPAGDADEALQLLAELGESFNVLVSDLNLPGMDGVELIAEARRRHPHLRCVVLSGSPPEAANVDVLPDIAWILKPYSTEELVARLREAFEGKP